ncbi:hypothetical protein Tsubulata_035203 [Turnera subulata]|uniref:peptidyl-tRNA hydrolase n=1 Tax=Turnera subulata TaxID=218843 RepID=A0A9Q0J1M8_9ROSI|nr:hypothetical protein Tsubulata_035203 [Turnera subulata]
MEQKQKQHKQERKGGGLSESFRIENFLPGLIIGFIFGMFLDLAIPGHTKKKNVLPGKAQNQSTFSNSGDQELKLVLVVRQDLKMGAGKIASQCAHAATGMYSELLQSHRLVLRQWEQNGQPKIVVTCKNQQEMNKLKEAAESNGVPTFVVADAGRTQVSAGSKTVLAVGPGPKALVDSVTGKQRLLVDKLQCRPLPVKNAANFQREEFVLGGVRFESMDAGIQLIHVVVRVQITCILTFPFLVREQLSV